MARHRTPSIAFERQVAQDYLAGKTLHSLARRHDLPLQIVPTRPSPLAARTKLICETRVRYGYRRAGVLLRREGWHVNQKRIRRIYNDFRFAAPE